MASILNFMPQFVPWYTKDLLKKKDDPEVAPATEPSTGFFGDVFNFIDDAFSWPAAEEPETDWGGGMLGAGLGEQAYQDVPFTPEPFGDPQLYDVAEWGQEEPAPSTFSTPGPIFGGMFDNITGAVRDEIAPSPWLGGEAGLVPPPGPSPMTYPEISTPWQDAWSSWSPTPAPLPFASNFGGGFRERLAGVTDSADYAPDLVDLRTSPLDGADMSQWGFNPLATVPETIEPSPAWGQFAGLGDIVSDIMPTAKPFTPQDWGIPGMEQYAGDYQLGSDWSMFGNGDTGLGLMPSGWDSMSPQERGEQVYFSGLEGNDFLTEADYAAMPPDLAQKIGYADSRIDGGISNGFSSLWNTAQTPVNAALNTVGDAILDPILDPLTSTGNIFSPLQEGFWSNPGININFGGDPGNVDWSLPLEDTVSNARDASNPWDFMEKQEDEFVERPFLQQLAIGALSPGGGIWKNIEGAPAWLRALDSGFDIAQGGAAFDGLGSIPGASSAMKNVVVPGAIGGTGGALTEAIFDPTFTDQWGNEYDPNMLESILAGTGLGIGGSAAMRSSTVPFGAGIRDEIPESVSTYVRRKAFMMEDQVFPDFPGSPTYGLPNTKGAPRKPPVKLDWDDPIDKAMYMASSGGTGKSSADAYKELINRGFDEADISEGGFLVRQHIARETRGFTGGERIRVPRIVRPEIPPTVAADGAIETPTDALIRQQQEIFASDPDAAGVFTTTGASVVPGQGAVTSPARPSIPENAPPPVRSVLEQIDAKLQNLASVDPVARRAEFDVKQTEIAAAARQAARDRGLIGMQVLEAGNAATFNRNIDELVPIVADPGPLRVDAEDLDAVAEHLMARSVPEQYRNMAARVLNKWQRGEKVFKTELEDLRGALTGEYKPRASTSTIDEIVPNAGSAVADVTGTPQPATVTTADGVVMSAPPAPKVNAPGIDPNDIADAPVSSPVARQAPKAIDPNDPLKGQTFTPSGIEKTDFPESEAVVQPSMKMGDEDPLRGRTPGTAPEPSDIPETVAKPIQPSMLEPIPAKYKDRVDEWMTEVRNKTARMGGEKRDDFLDKSQLQLAKKLRKDGDTEDAMRIAQLARDNAAKAIKTDRDFTDNAVRVAQIDEWRKRYEPELDKIDFDKNISPLVRGRGRIKNELADKLTDYGDRLRIDLENKGFTPEEAVGAVESEISRYLDRRAAEAIRRGDPDGLLNRTYTAIHTGPFKPKTPAGIRPVAEGVGEVRPNLQRAQNVAMEIKNSKFGLTDAAGIFANGAVTILQQPHSLAAYMLAQIANMAGAKIDLKKYMDGAELAGAMFTRQTDAMDPGAGSLIGHAGRALRDTPLQKVGTVLEAADEPLKKINFALEDLQYEKVLNQGLRKPAYQGNMLILDALSKIPVVGKYIDPADPKTQEAIARMVNASTSAARPARDNTRRAIEATGMTSARFTRAQLDLLAMLPRVFALKNVPAEERLVIAMTALSTAGVLGAAHLAADEYLNLDWDNPKDFGDLRVPNGQGGHMTLNLLPNKQAARALALSADTIKDYLGGDLKPDEAKQKLTDAWVRFGLGRLGPMITPPLNAIEIGFDPKTNTWNYPGIPGVSEGMGDGWGDTMDWKERLARMAPLPTGGVDFVADKLTGEEASSLSRIVNFIGASAFDDKPVVEALRSEGYEDWDAFEAKNPDTFASRKVKFFEDHPELDDFSDTVPSQYREEKKKNSEAFMTSRTGQTVKKWRDANRDLGNNIEGAFAEMALESGERPEKDGSAQWIYDFNQTFAQAKNEPLDPTSQMDMEVLGELQAEFWSKHKDPKVRKEILAYQMEKAETEADKQWIASMARLNGFDPETGKPLKYPTNNRPMPNYFEMDRYDWTEVPNEEARQFREKFDQWKLDQSAKVRELGTDKLIKLYIDSEPEVATRITGEAWTPAAIKDVQNYGKPSKEDPVYTEYKQIMQPDLLWFKPDQYWDNIEAALVEKYGRMD